jgi:predicted ATPase/DNA-binding CsgD family transcriptional regulator
LAEIEDLVGGVRLVTLTGSGGCGKTRLGVEFAARAAGSFRDGVWWIDLGSENDPRRVVAHALSSFAIGDTGGQEPIDRLCDHVRDIEGFVVLDNCEHLLAACAELVEALLRTASGVRILATSREPLGVPGEVAWSVPSLSSPVAVQLFVERARTARPNFSMTDQVASTVTEICSRLDGIPLAIELAAARVRMMTVDDILRGLEDRFRLLTGGARTAMARQQTLEASVGWSYGLMDDAERLLFRRLSVFADGFSLDGAERVCSREGLEVVDVLGLISRLVDKSMIDVAPDDHTATARYRLLDTIRQFAKQQLIQSDETEAVRDRHLDYCVDLAVTAEFQLEQACLPVLESFEIEHGNMRAALEWGLVAPHGEKTLRLAAALGSFWLLHGHYSEGKEWTQRAVSSFEGSRFAAWPKASFSLGWLRFMSMDFASGYGAGDVRAALAAARAAGDELVACRAEAQEAMHELYTGSDSGPVRLHEAIAVARRLGDPWTLGLSLGFYAFHAIGVRDRPQEAKPLMEELSNLGQTYGNAQFVACVGILDGIRALRAGELSVARSAFTTALTESYELGDPVLEVLVGDMFAELAIAQGCFDEARESLMFGIEREGRSAFGRAEMLHARLAEVTLLQGDVDGARQLFEEVPPVAWRVGLPSQNVMMQCRLAEALQRSGQRDRARSLVEASLALARKMRMPSGSILALLTAARIDRSAGEENNAEQCCHEALAIASEHGLRPALVDVLEELAGLAVDSDSFAEAARVFATAESMRNEMGYVRPPILAERYGAEVAATAQALGDEGFAAAWAEGEALGIDEVFAYVTRARGQRKRPTFGWSSLTPTELQVVALATDGMSNAEIGRSLFISAGTAKTHLSHVYAKLGVANRAELAAHATRHRIEH